jgi:hypothetical protein
LGKHRTVAQQCCKQDDYLYVIHAKERLNDPIGIKSF